MNKTIPQKPVMPAAHVNSVITKADEPQKLQAFTPHSFSTQISYAYAAPKLLITPEVHAKMVQYVDLAKDEVGWLGSVRELEDGNYLVDGVFMIEQEVHSTTTELKPEGIAKLVNELLRSDDETLREKAGRLFAWFHSHVNMEVSPSGQDDQTMTDVFWKTCPFAIRGILNKRGKMGVTIYDYEKHLTFKDAAWAIFYENEDNDELRRQIAEEMLSKVSKKQIATPSYKGYETTGRDSYRSSAPTAKYSSKSEFKKTKGSKFTSIWDDIQSSAGLSIDIKEG